MNWLTSIFIILLTHLTIGQQVINYKQLISESKHDTTLAKTYANWGESLYMSKPDSAIILFNASLKICEKDWSGSSPRVQQGMLTMRATMYNNLAYMVEQQGDILMALDYYDRSLHLNDSLGNRNAKANCLNNIGFIFFRQNEHTKAKSYYQQSIDIRLKLKDSSGLAQVYNNMGLLHRSIDDYDEALTYYGKSLDLRRALGQLDAVANSLNNIGFVFFSKGEHKNALINFWESIALHRISKSVSGESASLLNSARCHNELGNLDSTSYYALRADSLAKVFGYPSNVQGTSAFLYMFYKEQGDYTNALAAYELATQMEDSLHNDETQAATIRLQFKHENEKLALIHQREEIERHKKLEKDKAVSLEKEKRLKFVIIAGSIGLILILAFLVYVYSRMRIIRAQKGVIEEKNHEITDSINYAKRIQDAILPSSDILEKLPEHFIYYQPKDIVSGDFYWVNKRPDCLYIAAADCTGHGVPGAMVSVICSNALTKSVNELGATQTGQILDFARNEIVNHFSNSNESINDGMDISLCKLVYADGLANHIEFSGAHNPLWIVRDGELIELKGDKQPVGMYQNSSPFTTSKFDLLKNDILYLFSDGFIDQFGGLKGKKYKSANFKKLLMHLSKKDLINQKELLHEELLEWQGDLEQLDDICIIGLRV